MRAKILAQLQTKKDNSQKSLAVLLDPDKVELATFPRLLAECVRQGVDLFFVGGSLISRYTADEIIEAIHKHTPIPAILFPGNSLHIEPTADAILLLSLISGRNPEFLIGQHVVAAPLLKRSPLEVLPTGYMLIESGRPTTVSYISNTTPIPHDKPSVAACTAMAGEMLGLKIMYLDAGSGALNPVSAATIKAVRKAVDTPIIVGGGINSYEKALEALNAGADVIVVGNGFEENPNLLPEIMAAVREVNGLEVAK